MILKEAKKLIDLGMSVLPCYKYLKHPGAYWKEYQTKRATYEQWGEWDQVGNITGICLITGEISGVVIIDVDSEKDEGLHQELKTHFGLNSGVVSKTRSGGYHYFYKWEEKTKTMAQIKKGMPVDSRGDGGLVIIPPSVADDSDGKNRGEYSWISELTQKSFRELPALPKDIKRWRRDSDKTTRTADGWIEVNPSAENIEGTEEGSRNEKLFKYACRLRSLGLKKEDALLLSSTKNKTFVPKPLPSVEIRQAVDSAFSYKKEEGETGVVEYSGMKDSSLTDIEDVVCQQVGISSLDLRFGWPSGLTLICGKTNCGKGFFYDWLARKFYDYNKTKTIVFSLEMDEKKIRKRCLQSWSDMTQEEYHRNPTEEAKKRLRDSFRVVHYKPNSNARKRPEQFEKDFEYWYGRGYRHFAFDHMLQIAGATGPNFQTVVQEWAGAFVKVLEKFPGCWLHVYTQERIEPRGATRGKEERTNIVYISDVQGAKSIVAIADTFIGISRGSEDGVRNDKFYIHVEKARDVRVPDFIYPLYFAPDGNFYASGREYNASHTKALKRARERAKNSNMTYDEIDELLKLEQK